MTNFRPQGESAHFCAEVPPVDLVREENDQLRCRIAELEAELEAIRPKKERSGW